MNSRNTNRMPNYSYEIGKLQLMYLVIFQGVFKAVHNRGEERGEAKLGRAMHGHG